MVSREASTCFLIPSIDCLMLEACNCNAWSLVTPIIDTRFQSENYTPQYRKCPGWSRLLTSRSHLHPRGVQEVEAHVENFQSKEDNIPYCATCGGFRWAHYLGRHEKPTGLNRNIPNLNTVFPEIQKAYICPNHNPLDGGPQSWRVCLRNTRSNLINHVLCIQGLLRTCARGMARWTEWSGACSLSGLKESAFKSGSCVSIWHIIVGLLALAAMPFDPCCGWCRSGSFPHKDPLPKVRFEPQRFQPWKRGKDHSASLRLSSLKCCKLSAFAAKLHPSWQRQFTSTCSKPEHVCSLLLIFETWLSLKAGPKVSWPNCDVPCETFGLQGWHLE